MISVVICSLAINLSKRAFSTLSTLPRNGKIAWNLRSRPCLAEPPAESPSTIYSSHNAGSFSWQSASLPGRPAPSNTLLRRVISRALRAASRARAASTTLAHSAFASVGFSNNQVSRVRATASSTAGRTSLDTNLSFVWLLNFGSGTFTDKTHVNPSRMSSPVVSTLAFLAISLSPMYLFKMRVMAARKPVKCVPPSRCGMLLVKQSTCSL